MKFFTFFGFAAIKTQGLSGFLNSPWVSINCKGEDGQP